MPTGMVEPRHSRTLVSLDDTEALDATLVGSKAANLAEAIRAGFPVPAGAVVTTARAGVSTEVAEEILDRLGHVPLAVRSSATAEDLPDSSYAGQYESYLNIEGRQKLLVAIEACRASLYSNRVSSYSKEESSNAMAVLIQPMIDAGTAGVAFSAHPVSGARNQVVVNAVRGLGDQLVSGEVTPSQWVVEGDRIEGTDGLLTPAQILQIAELARAAQIHFGSPQDIEWAHDGETLWLLQARPITSLPEPPVEPIPIDVEIPDGYWEHDASHFPTASYPIDSGVPGLVAAGVETWVNEFGYLFDGIEFRNIGGWTYQRLRPIGGKDGPDLPGWLMWMLVRTIPMLRRRISVAREAVHSDKPGRFIGDWYDSWLPELSDSIRALQGVDRSALSDKQLQDHCDTVLALVRRGIEVHALVHGALAPIIYELVTTCHRLLGWDMAETLRMVNGTSFKSTEPARRLNELAARVRRSPELLDAAGIPEEQVLAHLGQVDPEFASAFTRYLHEYGHRALGDSTAEPTIAERPLFVLGMIQSQIATGYDPEAVDQSNARLRKEAIADARRQLTTSPEALAEFDRVLERAQQAYPAREDNEFYTLSAPFALMRYVVLELGDRLAARNVVDRRHDVLFLHLNEARAALINPADLRDRVQRRKGERAWAIANPGPPSYGKESPPPASLSFLPADSRLPMESMLWSLESMMAIEASNTTQSDSSTIRGTPVSAGTYTGPVRIVTGESEFDKLHAGDVLVCPITSPVWSVLFPTIGGLVTDSGGILSHPAIIAREYRIPAVVATGNATELLENGQIVTVDGSTGSVTMVERPS